MPLPFAHETITLYNRKLTLNASGRTITTWQRTVLHECFWMQKTSRAIVNGAVQIINSIKCRIPESLDYVKPDVWQTLEDTTGHFTLDVGDLIVHSEITDEISSEFTEVALKEKYDKTGCMVVMSAKDFAFQGSPIKHYAAEGV